MHVLITNKILFGSKRKTCYNRSYSLLSNLKRIVGKYKIFSHKKNLPDTHGGDPKTQI